MSSGNSLIKIFWLKVTVNRNLGLFKEYKTKLTCWKIDPSFYFLNLPTE